FSPRPVKSPSSSIECFRPYSSRICCRAAVVGEISVLPRGSRRRCENASSGERERRRNTSRTYLARVTPCRQRGELIQVSDSVYPRGKGSAGARAVFEASGREG